MPRSAADFSGLPLRQVFAKNLRLARIHAGMSQEGLAHAAGLDRAFVGTAERGQRNISIDNVERLSKVVGIAPHELLDPRLAVTRGFDVTVVRAPRTARPYPVSRKPSAKSSRR